MKFIPKFYKWILSPRVLRRLLLAFVTTVTLLFLFYSFENWRAAKAWSIVLEERKNSGEPTDWTQIIPPTPPSEKNFCTIPLFQQIEASSGKTLMPVEEKTSNKPFPKGGNLFEKHALPLADIAAYYRGTPAFPAAPKEASDAEVVLVALSRYQGERNQLVQALRKPSSLFPIDYYQEPAWNITLPHLASLISLSRTLHLHATASLAAGKNQEALDDIRIQFRLLEATSQDPILISHLLGATLANITLTSIWEGLSRRAWTSDELDRITRLLQSQDFLRNARTALEGEQLMFFTRIVDYLKQSSPAENLKFLNLLLNFQIEEQKPNFHGRIYGLGMGYMPRGWWDQNKIKAFSYYKTFLFDAIDTDNHRVNVSKNKAFKAQIDSERANISPYNFLVAITLPDLKGVLMTMCRTQVYFDMARIACALELYCQKNGDYPETLEKLSPALPHDPISGEAYHYAKTKDGRYKLWSVGWNQTDEGGSLVYKDKKLDPLQGDWVWAYPE